MVDPERYRKLFVQEAREHLAELQAGLDVLAGGYDRDAVDGLFRAAHSFKGMAATLDHVQIAQLAHAIEDHLEAARHGATFAEGDLAAIVHAVDRLADAVDAEESGHAAPDLHDETDALRARLVSAVSTAADRAEDGVDLVKAAAALPAHERRVVTARIADGCLAPKARLMILKRTVEGVARLVAVSPPETAWHEVRPGAAITVVAACSLDPATLTGRLSRIPELVDVQALDELPTGTHGRGAAGAGGAKRSREGGAPVLSTPRTVRLDLDDVDRLLDQAAELRIAHAQLERQLAGHFVGRRPYPLVEALQRLDREAKAIHDTALAMRTLPVRLITDRLPRLVRDLAGQLGKQVRLEVEGSDTQADRSVLEILADPLIHLVKNALDHGFEPPEERRAAGKPPIGRLTVAFMRTANAIRVTVRDDGRGIPRAAALAKAVAAGLVPPEAADSLPDDELFRLLSAPGFSTAEEVTQVSGRGVGLDAAKSSVERVGGIMRLASQAGQGTEVSLDLPPTLAVMEALEIVVDSEPYYVPIEAIVTTVAVDAVALARGTVDVVDPRRVAAAAAAEEEAGEQESGAERSGAPAGAQGAGAQGAGASALPVSAHEGDDDASPRLPPVPVRIIDLVGVLDLPPRRYLPERDGQEEKVERLKRRLREAAGAGEEAKVPETEPRPPRTWGRLGIVVEGHDGQLCLLAEGPGAIQEIVVKGFDLAAARARFVSGATVRGDGQVGLILDVPSILAAPHQTGLVPRR